jgi:murein L,D-transpeptidase YcbB/YkuD
MIHKTMKAPMIMFRLSIFILLLLSFQVRAQNPVALAIKRNRADLYYPHSVERFYKQNDYKLAWIAPDTVKTHAWEAMLMLDCVRLYGLSHMDYHPKQLIYDQLHNLVEQGGTDAEKARYDILLTDAMIRLMNDLHYGKLNPVYTTRKIDHGLRFKAWKELQMAIESQKFLNEIDKSQPKSKLYFDLQDHMRLVVGQRSGDCYLIPPQLIRKMAINMERLRWISSTGQKVHLTCIVRDGLVIYYKDFNNKDKKLEKGLYDEKVNTNL